jgi:TolA-binding protein
MANETPDQAPIAELDYEPSAFEQAFQKHKSKLILVAILGGVGALGYYSMKFWKEHQNTKDGLVFFKAETPADYDRVAKDLAGRNAGGNALLMAAQAMAEEGKPEEAVTKLQSFLKDYANHPLADLATLRLADALTLSGKVEEAKAAFSEVFSKFPKSPHAPVALLRLGDQFASEKKLDEARKQYELLKEKFPGTPYYEAMMKHRDALSRKDPTPVEFVPDAPAPPPTPGGPNGLPIQPGGAPSTVLDVPSLNPNPAATPAGGEKMPLEIPKLDSPAVPPAITPEKPADPAPAPVVPAEPAPTPVAPAPAAPAPEKPADK